MFKHFAAYIFISLVFFWICLPEEYKARLFETMEFAKTGLIVFWLSTALLLLFQFIFAVVRAVRKERRILKANSVSLPTYAKEQSYVAAE